MQPFLVVTLFISAFIYSGVSVAHAQARYYDRENLIPKCTLGANPVLVYSPYTTTLSWTTQNANQVSITDVGTVALSGQATVSNVYNDRTFTLTATNTYGTRTCSVQVFNKETPTGVQGTAYATPQYPPYYYNNPIYTNLNTNQAPVQGYGTQYAYNYNYANGTLTPSYYYTQNGAQYTYGTSGDFYGTPYGQTPAPTYNNGGTYRTVRLSRVPYTGPIEDTVSGLFSLAVLASSLYGMRRIVG